MSDQEKLKEIAAYISAYAETEMELQSLSSLERAQVLSMATAVNLLHLNEASDKIKPMHDGQRLSVFYSMTTDAYNQMKENQCPDPIN